MANLQELLQQYAIKVPMEVKIEVVDRGKEKGFSDAIIIEKIINEGFIEVIEFSVEPSFQKAANIAGLHQAEIVVVFFAFKNNILALLDEEAARVFAVGLGVKIKGSLGVLLDGFYSRLITRKDALAGLNKLSQIMYLSSDVYQYVLEKLSE